MMFFFGVPAQVVAKYSDISEEHTASIFMVTELVQDDDKML
jgi:hypothetical protein